MNHNFVLIAGGFDSDGMAMKSWQIYDPQSQQIICQGEMNFACAAGTLVTFNKSTVFKMGGLANKSVNQLTICPII